MIVILLQFSLVWLLKNRVHLGRITILLSIIPLYLSTIELLTIPMLMSAVVLFLTINYYRIKRSVINFIYAHIWLKIQYFWFSVAIFIFGWMIYENVKQYIILPYVIGLLYLIIYVIWFNKINTKMTEDGRRIILKGETTETSSMFDVEPYLIPILFTLMAVFLTSSLLSLSRTRGSSIFTIEEMYWYFPLAILIIHFVVDIIFVEQIDWYPLEGSTTWKPSDPPSEIPPIDQPAKLATYFAQLSRIRSPPEELEEFIEDNLEYLILHAQSLSYFPFQIEYVRCLENWGREGRDHIHLLMAIILASVSQYRFIGLIPVYKRKMFYQTLQAVAMSGSMTQRWREVIEYETDRRKDEHYVLDWVLGSKYLEFKYNPDWIVTWEGRIYKGKVGYYEAVRKIDMILQIRPEMNQWELDVWDLCYDYARVYVGEDSRKILSTNVHFYDQLLYLSAKRTTEEYFETKQKYKQELLNPSNRLVSIPTGNIKVEMDEIQKRDVINAYLDNEPHDYKVPSLWSALKTSIRDAGSTLRNLQIMSFLKVVLFLAIFASNLAILLLLDNFFVGQTGFLVVVIEVVVLFIFSVSPSTSDFKLQDQQSTQKQVLATSTYSQSSINVTTANFSTATLYLLYGIALLFTYRYLAF